MLRKMLLASLAYMGACGVSETPSALGPHGIVDFERPVQFVYSEGFKMFTMAKGTTDLWEEARVKAPRLFNDHPNLTLAPLIVKVLLADTEDQDTERFDSECNLKRNQAYTPYGTPEIYICAKHKFDEPPGVTQDAWLDPWRGTRMRCYFLGHEAGHGLCGAPHTPKDVPGIMCGSPYNDPNLCYATLTGFTAGDKEIMCVPMVTGGFCLRPVAQFE